MSDNEFTDTLISFSRRLYSIAFRILRTKEDAEDAVQEIMMKLWNKRSSLGDYNSLEALAVVMIRNSCIDSLRRKKPDSVDDINRFRIDDECIPTPHDVYSQKETMIIIESIIERMPENYSEAIRKKDVEGLDYIEIAKTMNQNVNTIRVLVSRARKQLRDEFKKISYEPQRSSEFAGKIL